MSLIPWDEDNDDDNPIGSITNQFPLVPNIAPPSDYPLDPHNDLLPPGYALPLANMMMGPPEVVHKRYFSLTVDDIHKFQKEKMKKWIKVYEKVLGMCFRRIRDHVLRDEKICLFVIPSYIPGYPLFNMTHCCAFIIRKLRLAGFKANYTPSNTIIISWIPEPNYSKHHMENKPKASKPVHVHKPKEVDKDIHYITLEPQEPEKKYMPPVQQAPKKSTRYGQQKEEPFLFQ